MTGDCTGPRDLDAEAARLATETVFSQSEWLSALTRIGGRPGRDELVTIIGETAAANASTPGTVALILLGDEISQGMTAAYASHWRSMRELVTDAGVTAGEVSSLASAIARIGQLPPGSA